MHPLSELRTPEEVSAAENGIGEVNNKEIKGEVNPNAVEQSSKPVTAGLIEAEELESYIAIRGAKDGPRDMLEVFHSDHALFIGKFELDYGKLDEFAFDSTSHGNYEEAMSRTLYCMFCTVNVKDIKNKIIVDDFQRMAKDSHIMSYALEMVVLSWMVFEPLIQNWRLYVTEGLNNASVSTRPDVVNIASILTFNSIIGKVAKIALQAAIDDVNIDPTILSGTKIKITFHDSNYSAFMSIIEALQVMETDSVARPLNNCLSSRDFPCGNKLIQALSVIDDVNADLTILSENKLKITFHNSNYSAFMSIMEEFGNNGDNSAAPEDEEVFEAEKIIATTDRCLVVTVALQREVTTAAAVGSAQRTIVLVSQHLTTS
ncbi:glutamate receptor 3.6-like protein [Tanacetum coccineum]